MAKKEKEEKGVKRSRGNNSVMKNFKNLKLPVSLWGQFFNRLPGGPSGPVVKR
jgi:hypothetical protein